MQPFLIVNYQDVVLDLKIDIIIHTNLLGCAISVITFMPQFCVMMK